MRWLGMLALVAVTAVACSEGAPDARSPRSSAATPTVTPGTEALQGAPDPLPPGRYSHAAFDSRLSFAVGTGWSAEQFASGFFDVQRLRGTPDVMAVQFAWVVSVGGSAEAVTSPDRAADAIASTAHLKLLSRTRTRLGGRDAVQVVVDTTDAASSDPPIFRPVIEVPAGPISIASGRRLSLTLLPTDQGLLGVLVGGSIARWAETVRLTSPIVSSVSFAG